MYCSHKRHKFWSHAWGLFLGVKSYQNWSSSRKFIFFGCETAWDNIRWPGINQGAQSIVSPELWHNLTSSCVPFREKGTEVYLFTSLLATSGAAHFNFTDQDLCWPRWTVQQLPWGHAFSEARALALDLVGLGLKIRANKQETRILVFPILFKIP